MKPIAVALTVATVALAGCTSEPQPEPISDQDYGGKVSAGHGAVVTRGSVRCPDWASVIYRGDLYCVKSR